MKMRCRELPFAIGDFIGAIAFFLWTLAAWSALLAFAAPGQGVD
jgi:hypothetical protein